MINQITNQLIIASLDFLPILKKLQIDKLEPNMPLWRELANYDSELPQVMKEQAQALLSAIEDYIRPSPRRDDI